MRWSAAALLVPLFLLPLVAAGVLAAWARAVHHDALDRMQVGGAAAWFDKSPELAAAARAAFDKSDRAGPHAIPITIAGRAYLVEPSGEARASGGSGGAGSGELGREPWTFARRYPAAFRLDHLVRNRLAAETGRAERPAAAQAFVELRARLDRKRLRTAPLPAGTKLYLARRGGWTDVLPFLEAVRALPDNENPEGLAPGRHGNLSVPIRPRAPLILHLRAPPSLPVGTSTDGRFRLHFGSRSGALWIGHLEAPLAGPWSIESVHGDRWWAVPVVRRWVGPALALFAAYLVLPIALAFELRRRRRAAEARARLLNELAHDLRTPLAAVRLHAELLSSRRVPDVRRDKSIDVVAREAARLSNLLANLLDLSRLERGTRLFDVGAVDVAALVDEAVCDFLAVHPERRSDLHVSVPGAARAPADRTALARVLANLLDNAGKFTEPGTAIRIAWANGELTIEDDGCGVTNEDRPALFRRYARGKAAIAAAVPGTGMGLALVRDLMGGMGGSVRYEPTARFVVGFAHE